MYAAFVQPQNTRMNKVVEFPNAHRKSLDEIRLGDPPHHCSSGLGWNMRFDGTTAFLSQRESRVRDEKGGREGEVEVLIG